MPQTAWSAKRKRQYLHIKDSLLAQGRPEPLAEENSGAGREQGTRATR